MFTFVGLLRCRLEITLFFVLFCCNGIAVVQRDKELWEARVGVTTYLSTRFTHYLRFFTGRGGCAPAQLFSSEGTLAAYSCDYAQQQWWMFAAVVGE